MAITGGIIRAYYGTDEMKVRDYLHISFDAGIPAYLQGSLSDEQRTAIVDAMLNAAIAAFPAEFGIAIGERIDETPTEVIRR